MRPRAALALSALLTVHGCGALAPGPAVLRPGSPPALLAVLAPESEADDDPGALTDNALAPGAWYCSGARPPQRFEVMFRDGAARPIRAVGFVLGNAGPGAPGPFTVRVQRGHGVVAPGASFRVSAEVLGTDAREGQGPAETVPGAGPSGARRYVIELPVEARGDHVLLRFDARPRRATARCLGEFEVYVSGAPLPDARDALRVAAVPEPARPDAGEPDGADLDASADAAPGVGRDEVTPDAEAGGDAARALERDAELDANADVSAVVDATAPEAAVAPTGRPSAPRR